MNAYVGDAQFDHARAEGRAVLLTNLGTPDAPTAAAVRRYLAQFLSDPRVVEAPRWLWWPVLHGVILRLRPRRSARAYARVWTSDGSPLLVNGLRQAAALEAELARRGVPVPVRLAMRYGNPSVADTLAEFRGQGLRDLLVLPLYPQYSGATTGSTFDALAEVLGGWRRVPGLTFVDSYHAEPGYVDALVSSVRRAWSEAPAAERLLMSFHGLPRRFLLAGDPYHCQCHATARLLAERLGLAPDRWQVSFQSRVGRERWLEPYTDATLARWAGEGVRSVDVLCPGFAADCLETLEEVDIRERERFLGGGGERFRYIPALNDAAEHIGALASLVLDALPGRVRAAPDAGELAAREARAGAMRAG